jgi:hypothetical protein
MRGGAFFLTRICSASCLLAQSDIVFDTAKDAGLQQDEMEVSDWDKRLKRSSRRKGP